MKKAIGLLMAIFIVINTFMNSMIQSYAAAPIVYTYYQLMEAMMGIYGVTSGYGESVSGFDDNMNPDLIKDMENAWLNGATYQFTNGHEVGNFFEDPALFIEFIEDVYQMTIEYNASQVFNEAYYALNDKSYAASGTLASKTMEYKLAQVLDYVQGTDTATLGADLQNALTATTTDDVAQYMTNVKSFKYIMDGIFTAYMVLSTIGTSGWAEPITSDTYKISDLHQIVINYSGTDYEVYNTKTFSFNLSNGRRLTITANKPFILFPFISNNMKYYTIMAKDAITCSWVETDISTGIVVNSTTITPPYNSSYMCYYRSSGLSGEYVGISNLKTIDSSTQEGVKNKIKDTYITNDASRGLYLGNASSMSDTDAGLEDALTSFWDLNGITGKDIIDLGDTLTDTVTDAGTDTHTKTITDTITDVVEDTKTNTGTDVNPGTGTYSSILDKILAAILALAAAVWNYFATPIYDMLDLVGTIDVSLVDLAAKILTLPRAIWDEFAEAIEAIKNKVLSIDTDKPWQGEGDNESQSVDLLDIMNGLIVLIMILFMLLKIFVHCLEFIIKIFAIPASTAMIPDDMLLGLNHIKSLEIPGIGLSVYDFMMGLVYILIVFYCIRILRTNVDRIRVPKKRSGGFS